MNEVRKNPFWFLPQIDKRIVVMFMIGLILLMSFGIVLYQSGHGWAQYVIYATIILNMFSYPLYVNGKRELTKAEERMTIISIVATLLLLAAIVAMMVTGRLG